MIYLNDVLVDDYITKFPDGTSQVWHLPKELIEAAKSQAEQNGVVMHHIRWLYTDDNELLKLQQLTDLLADSVNRAAETVQTLNWCFFVYVPFLPYARQDKEVSNDATFAFTSFCRQFALLYSPTVRSNVVFTPCLSVVDPHNEKRLVDYLHGVQIEVYKPNLDGLRKFYHDQINDLTRLIFIFPDAGAAGRYAVDVEATPTNVLCLKKSRDAETGKITNESLFRSLKLAEIECPDLLHAPGLGTHFVIADDLCDGGATFLQLARVFRDYREQADPDVQTNLHLFISHGIFSAGLARVLSSFNTVTCTDSTFGLPGAAAKLYGWGAGACHPLTLSVIPLYDSDFMWIYTDAFGLPCRLPLS